MQPVTTYQLEVRHAWWAFDLLFLLWRNEFAKIENDYLMVNKLSEG
jgi:hypothetical protein